MLLEGAYDGRYEDVERWAAEGVRVDCVDGVGNRPLSEAANAGDARMVHWRLKFQSGQAIVVFRLEDLFEKSDT